MWVAIAPLHWRAEWQAPVQEIASAITPTMFWREQVLLLDVQASLRWLGGIRGLKRRVYAELSALDMTVAVAVTPTALGAWLLAISSDHPRHLVAWHYALSNRRLSQRLDMMLIERLPTAKPYAAWLHRVGCQYLGQLRQLDRAELTARTSPALLKSLDQAYGQVLLEYEPLKLAPKFYVRRELPRLIEHVSGLEPAFKKLFDDLCTWLKAHHLAVSRLECRLHHRDRRRAWSPSTLILAVSEPTDSFAVLWRWWQVRLERTRLPAPVSDITLLTRVLAPRPEHTGSLFADDYVAPESVSETLDLLRARLGQTGVQQAAPTMDYRIEAANQWSTEDARQSSNVLLDRGSHCPAWLVAEPKALAIRHDQPYLEGPLQLLQGPYRIETGWWDQGFTQRDYFIATDQSQRRYWIYRERDQVQAHWFLHGLFG